ncbi:sugar ABC transporter ATP-binding protein [Paraburkholderia sp. HD33-4]|uniref:sugar ABC transporter ATP-binding protein n=1 Tax=Paraburkholderia sp. HD33-4 TaxID=2883242 RepID=UPI001F36D1F1|nr:sugar ABC transporter ATP-binding protein [Paraburkholderia sp. HD33-4]
MDDFPGDEERVSPDGVDQSTSATDASDLALEMRNIQKRFPGVHALKGVSLKVRRGHVLALVGENGAGKSTLMKILSGAYVADEGEVVVGGETVANPTPQSMIDRGVAVIYQELSLAPHLSVAENVFLGCLPRARSGTIDWRKAARDTEQITRMLGFELEPQARVNSLSVAQRQMVEIARALARKASILVLDEPSAVLGDAELEKLFNVVDRLRGEGVSFVYISHRLNEVFRISQDITVLRDGGLVGSRATSEVTQADLVRMMVGREITDIYPTRNRAFGEIALEAKALTRGSALRDVSLHVRQGEIVGICGLAGAGRTELLRALLGADPVDAGEVHLHGKPFRRRSPRRAITRGMGLITEDRKTDGLFLDQSVAFNVTISKLSPFTQSGLLRLKKEERTVSSYIERLNVRTPSPHARIRNLSGGNQQKCALARYLNANCTVLLVDEPTRGVDVGAKREMYQLIAELADRQKAAVLMVSSELPEILGLSDRIYVMKQGRIAAELPGAGATEESIMSHAT